MRNAHRHYASLHNYRLGTAGLEWMLCCATQMPPEDRRIHSPSCGGRWPPLSPHWALPFTERICLTPWALALILNDSRTPGPEHPVGSADNSAATASEFNNGVVCYVLLWILHFSSLSNSSWHPFISMSVDI